MSRAGVRILSLTLPNNIPVAARSFDALESLGRTMPPPGYIEQIAVILENTDKNDPLSVWVAPSYRYYKKVWSTVSEWGWVDPVENWGPHVDIDHVYPKSWAIAENLAYVRLFPVWSEVNRSAGGGREKTALQIGRTRSTVLDGVVYAEELQVLKILGLPVGTAREPQTYFRSRKRK